jgi:hypothetical protein
MLRENGSAFSSVTGGSTAGFRAPFYYGWRFS